MQMSKAIGFLGLGNLGRPIVTNLIEAGYEVAIYNRDESKVEPFLILGATHALRTADAVSPGGIVCSLLWDDASVEEVVRSDDFLSRLGPDGVHVSMTTVSPECSKRLIALHAEHGVTMVEAPIFGRPEAATAKKLWIVTAGKTAAKDRARPVLEAAGAQSIFDFGEDGGAALVVKLIGNLLIISAGTTMKEGLSLAREMGVDPKGVVDMLTQTLFPAPIYQSYGALIASGAQSFGTSPILGKDVSLLKTAANSLGLKTPVTDMLLAGL
jgi:3-hydroxyisobutyrate dehydrogenase-like beta-hydroxyacid dehydrogenase